MEAISLSIPKRTKHDISNCFSGYGHVTPLSEGGKVFCIVYAAIGIPLTLIMFTALVERLMVLTTKMLQSLTESLGHLYRTIHIRLIHLSIILVVLIIFVFIIPSTIFFVLEEKWNFLDAFYYCFISMTTIGLGDYIPGDDPDQKHRPLYKICTTCKYSIRYYYRPTLIPTHRMLYMPARITHYMPCKYENKYVKCRICLLAFKLPCAFSIDQILGTLAECICHGRYRKRKKIWFRSINWSAINWPSIAYLLL